MPPAASRMSRSFNLLAGLLLLLGVVGNAAHAAGPDLIAASGGLWHDVVERDVQPAGARWIVPEKYRLVALDRSVLQERRLQRADGGQRGRTEQPRRHLRCRCPTAASRASRSWRRR